MRLNVVCFSILLLNSFVFAQERINISGKVMSDTIKLSDVFIELHYSNHVKIAVSDMNGSYKFENLNSKYNDTLNLKIKHIGYKSISQKIFVDKKNIICNIDLGKPIVKMLDEVIIDGSKNTHTAYKSIYKIDSKKFIKNSKVSDVISTIPSLYYKKQTNEVIVDGSLKAKILIDGVEGMPNEIKQIYASEIEKIEVISNPSSIYGTDFLGAVLNVILKKSKEQFIKGSMGVGIGSIYNFYSLSPNFSYKKGKLNISTNASYLKNNQNSTDELNRYDMNTFYSQNSSSNIKLVQNYLETKVGLNFSDKSKLSITSYLGGYNFKGLANGNYSTNNFEVTKYNNDSKIIDKDIELGTVYKYKINSNKSFFLKSKYAIIENTYASNYNDLQYLFFNVKSGRKEFLSNISYNLKNLKLFHKTANINNNLNYTVRDYYYSNTNFYIDQKIINATTEIYNDWNKKFSTQLSLTFENFINKNDNINNSYNYLLPTLNALYRFENINIKFAYSKKVLRPNPTDLNQSIIVLSPTIATQGNSDLKQQIRDYYSLKFIKDFDEDNFSIKFYRINVNNSIINVYKKQNELLIKTFDNAAKYNSTGINFDFTTSVKKVAVNLNADINYNFFKTNDNNALIKSNRGIGFNSSVNLFCNFFKDKLSTSFSGIYSGPDYTLLSKSISYPYFDFSINTNLFKDKIGLSFYFQNLLGNNATKVKQISYTDNFSQEYISKNNFTNIILTLTYNFGKKFESIIEDSNIEITDIRKK